MMLLSALMASALSSCNDKLTRELEEEKSYTRNAMERYRRDPGFFQGDKDVLENWSRMDYVAVAVVQHDTGNAEWARTADLLSYVATANQRDTRGIPYCVLKTKDGVTVVGLREKSSICELGKTPGAPPTLRSGYMSSGVYVLRP
jgi:hypothetical protein